MQTMVQANQTSNALLWVGRAMSGLVIALMLFDGVMKLIPLDVVISTSEQMGIPGSLARPLGVIGLVCTLLYAFPRSSVLGAHTLFGLYLGLRSGAGSICAMRGCARSFPCGFPERLTN